MKKPESAHKVGGETELTSMDRMRDVYRILSSWTTETGDFVLQVGELNYKP